MATVDVTDLARTVLDAHIAHENKYDPYSDAYTMTYAECLRAACVAHNIPEDAAGLLLIADDWPNDTDDWAKRVLSKEATV